MAVRKLSVALNEDVAAAAAEAAEEAGLSLSAWLNQAAESKLRIRRGLAAVAEWEAENGPFSEEAVARADAVFDLINGPNPPSRIQL